MKKIIICILILILGFMLGFYSKINEKQPTQITCKDENLIPECNYGRCPEYLFSWDINNNWLSESVVNVPTAMTKGGGQIWIIEEGKVVFKTDELAEINAQLDKEEIFVTYVSEWRDGVYPLVWKKDKLVFQDGNYKLVNVSEDK